MEGGFIKLTRVEGTETSEMVWAEFVIVMLKQFCMRAQRDQRDGKQTNKFVDLIIDLATDDDVYV